MCKTYQGGNVPDKGLWPPNCHPWKVSAQSADLKKAADRKGKVHASCMYGKENNKYNRRQGRTDRNLIHELQLEVHNKAGNPPTYQNRAGAESTISNARAANQIRDWKVEGNLTMSDHNLISLVIQKVRTDDMGPMVKRYDMYRANWETLRAEFDTTRPEGNEDVHEYAKRISKEIKRVMDLAIPQTYSAKYARNDAWSDELTRLRGQVRNARRRYQRSGIHEERRRLLRVYRTIKQNYIEQIAETKARSWGRFVQTHLATDAWGMPYKIVTKKIRCPTMLSSLEREDGSMTRTWELLVNTWLPSDVHEGKRLNSKRQEGQWYKCTRNH
ncbi:hypothetical protein JTB14_001960 [Gonioctena quinquepunctata]|nr:hypothetical protein JTB14_001960 [Gonioctena quinquepunctata]